MTGVKLKGIKPSRPAERKRLSLRHKKVFRAYGGKKQLLSIYSLGPVVNHSSYFTLSGVLSHKAVREKIVRAFLIEEQKLVNLLMRDQQVQKKE